jgi:DNA polymerase
MDPTADRYLRSLAAAGVRRVPRAALRPVDADGVDADASPPGAVGGADAGTERALTREAADALEAVCAGVAACTACRLSETRTRVVPGEGAADARIVFVGEGPGADEDKTGRPFVGRAGRLLDDIITKGMRLSRAEVYICNVVKCRPPGNRVPAPDEVEACSDWLDRQLAAIAPRVICTLGATAARRLLDTDAPMGRLRQREHAWRGIPVVVTYHPAYLLRNPAAKVPTWEDIRRVMELAAPA